MENFSRTELLLGKESMQALTASRVAVFGVGGVGGYCVEALARSGVGALDLIDNDRVSESNINRQIYATVKTIGRYKVDVAAERISEINPDCTVRTYKVFFLPETESSFDFGQYDYVVDAVDTVAAKIALARKAAACGTSIISSMGAGNKLDPTAFKVADIYKTKVCPLARVMRRELKKRGIERLKVVYSEEEPVCPEACEKDENEFCGECSERDSKRRSVPGSVAFVPSVAGLVIAGEVIKDLIKNASFCEI